MVNEGSQNEVERKHKHGRVEELLQEAEVEESLTDVVATMGILKSTTKESDSLFGPTLNV